MSMPGAAPRGLRLLLAGAALALVAACMDGYPDEAASSSLHPFDMTPAQRLDAMNALGASAHGAQRWTYEMRPGCVLRVDIDGPQGALPSVDIPLLGTSVGIAPDAARQRYDVEVQAQAHARVAHLLPGPVDALHATSWQDASWMLLLLKVSQALCLQGPQGAGSSRR